MQAARDPAAGELVGERAEQEVGVEGRHDLRVMGAALVLLHGFTQTGASWDAVRGALGPGPYSEILAPDLRGHGTRPRRAARLVRHRRSATSPTSPPPRFTLAGYSLGGRLALLFALACPERVERLVLIGATAGIEDDAERAARGGGRRGARATGSSATGSRPSPRVGRAAAVGRPAAGGGRRGAGRAAGPGPGRARRRAPRPRDGRRCRRAGTASASSACR